MVIAPSLGKIFSEETVREVIEAGAQHATRRTRARRHASSSVLSAPAAGRTNLQTRWRTPFHVVRLTVPSTGVPALGLCIVFGMTFYLWDALLYSNVFWHSAVLVRQAVISQDKAASIIDTVCGAVVLSTPPFRRLLRRCCRRGSTCTSTW